MAKTKKIEEKSALIIVDVQNDFCPGGALPVPDGNKVVAPLNEMIRLFVKEKLPIFASRDWHPKKTKHFKTDGGIWPPHCIRLTKGAEFRSDLELRLSTMIVSKGLGVDEDEKSYSAFGGIVTFPEFDPFSGWIDLGDAYPLELALSNVKTLYMGGLATDYCVKATVLDALELGFKVYLVLDACRTVNIKPTDEADAIAEMKAAGKKAGRGKFKIVTTKEVLGDEKKLQTD